MDCERWREALSARLDGEDPRIDERLLDAHVAGCDACRGFVERSRRRALRPAPAVPDLTDRVRRAVAVADRRRRPVARAMLAVVAIEIVVLSVPALVLGDGDGASGHGARHLGAFTVAYGVALLVVAARPARARTVLPVAAVLAAALVITAVVDLASGRIPLVGEARHIPEVLSVALVWSLATPAERPFTGRRRTWWSPTLPRSR